MGAEAGREIGLAFLTETELVQNKASGGARFRESASALSGE
jgi:acetyl-CoA carboxylase beta subunit